MPRSRLYLGLLATLTALPAAADHLEELVVRETHDTRTIDVTGELVIAPDVAQLLKRAPGANVNSNGPLTGIPQYRGMYGSRIATSLNGNQLAPAGPNWMDPPISYAVGGQLESLEVYRGIAPVSVAQESIGGAIDARTRHGEFTDSPDFRLDGRLIGSAQSVNDGHHLNTALYASNYRHRFKLAAMTEAGDDARFADGDITPTEYERQRYDLGYGVRVGNHSLQLDYGYNDTGEAGTPSLPMDISYFEGDLYNLTYRFDPATGIDATFSLYGSELDHGMTNYRLREAPEPARWRRNIAASENVGFNLRVNLADAAGAWSVGLDGFDETHDSDIDNPKNPMFFLVNFNDAERQVLGAFAERRQDIGDNWETELGVRYNRVTMDAGEVNGTPAMMMPPAQMLRDAFNAAEREQTDNNIDLVARARYKVGPETSWYLGAARKTRSPSYQERYLWLPLEATAGLADGYTYTGNINLDPEESTQVEFGFDYSGSRLTLSPRLFYNRVDDYIQGTPSEVTAALMFVRMMNAMNGTNNPDPLQFNNVDAELYGFDLDWAWRMGERWGLSGIVNYVRGERRDIDDDLYRIAPPNATFRLTYGGANWTAGIENVLYARQHRVSATNGEQKTAGYGILNLNATWQATPALQLAAGVDNVFDKTFLDHLGGYNRAANPDIARGSRLPGYGTNVFARVTFEF
jgi:iron complex outermembrane receptor protein